jgi:hypothetical protein
MAPDGLIALMLDFERSGLGQAARSTVWLYPIANFVHVVGASLLLGSIATFDIAVLRRLPAASTVARVAIPLAAFGLLLQFFSGLVLLSAEASTLVRNPAFQMKMAMLVLGLGNVAFFHWRFGGDLAKGGEMVAARPFAALSLIVWLLVVIAGRAIAYV